MKIAFFVTEFPVLSETFIVNQILELKKNGHLVHIFSQYKSREAFVHKVILDEQLLRDTCFIDDIPKSRLGKIFKLLRQALLNFSPRNLSLLTKSFFNKRSALSPYSLISFFDKPDYDVLHAHFGQNGNYVTNLQKLGLYENARFITTFHGYDLSGPFANGNFYQELFEHCECFTVNSKYSRGILKELGCPEDKIHLLPVGLDLSKFKTGSGTEKHEVVLEILFIGRFLEFKAPGKVLEICSILKDRNQIKFRACMIGGGGLYEEIERKLAAFHLEEEILLTGPKPQEYIVDAMKRADVFLYPGITFERRAENQGLVIQEAQAMQLPVIISDAGGMKEGVIDGETGFVLPENDLQGFVEKIELLASNPELRKQMGKRGREYVEKEFSAEVLNNKLLSLYRG